MDNCTLCGKKTRFSSGAGIPAWVLCDICVGTPEARLQGFAYENPLISDFIEVGRERGFIGLPVNADRLEEFLDDELIIELAGPEGHVFSRLYWYDEKTGMGGCISIPGEDFPHPG